jgi:hypothetical protein
VKEQQNQKELPQANRAKSAAINFTTIVTKEKTARNINFIQT